MTKRVAELTGTDLDRAVANAHGMMLYHEDFRPSRNWAQGGPIIEREKIQLSLEWDYFDDEESRQVAEWLAKIDWQSHLPPEYKAFGIGKTPLEAAMRAYVHSKLGPEVEDESI